MKSLMKMLPMLLAMTFAVGSIACEKKEETTVEVPAAEAPAEEAPAAAEEAPAAAEEAPAAAEEAPAPTGTAGAAAPAEGEPPSEAESQ